MVLGTSFTERVQRLGHIIKIAEECLPLNNYNAMMAIMSALQSPVIAGLTAVWRVCLPLPLQPLPLAFHFVSTCMSNAFVLQELPTPTTESFETLKATTLAWGNFNKYQKVYKMASPPCIPYLGTSAFSSSRI